MKKSRYIISAGAFLFLAVLISACSTQVQNGPAVPVPVNVTVVKRVDPNAHTHPAITDCTDSITHSHKGARKGHTHHYSCKKGARKGIRRSRNTHTHPANRCTNSITHTHPNGAKQHNHKYACQGGGRPSANMHSHPRTRCSKIARHSHKGGNRKHSHKYTCQGKRAKYGVYGANGHAHPANPYTKLIRHVHRGGNKPHTHHYSKYR